MPGFFQDARFGLRQLGRARLFSAVIVSTLALGIGVNAAIFSVIRVVFLKALPYGNADRLVTVWNDNRERGWTQFGTSLPDFLDWQHQSRSLASISAFWTGQGNLAGTDHAERIGFATVSTNLFGTLGSVPQLGRVFQPEEDQPGADAVAIVSDGFWRTSLGGRPDVIGRTVDLDGEPLRIIGVMPPGFAFPSTTIGLWKPLEIAPAGAQTDGRGARWLTVVAAIGPERSFAGAAAEMDAIGRRLAEQYPVTNRGWTISLEPIRTSLVSSSRQTLLIAWVAVALVLLIATANVANLLLARAPGRTRELAVRAALGADRARLIRQLLAESLVYAGLGTAGGLVLASLLLGWVRRLAPAGLPGGAQVVLDGWVMLYAIGVMLVVGLGVGVVPALRAGGVRLDAALKSGGRAGLGLGSRRFRDVLVVVEIALAAMVLVGAGLTTRSMIRLLEVNPGFRTDHRLTLSIAPSRQAMPERERAVAYYDQVMASVAAVQGVRRVGAINVLPVPGGSWWTTSLFAEGQGYQPGAEPALSARVVQGDYFAALGIPLVRGRALSSRDDANAEPVAVVDAAAAEQLWPGRDPLGRRVSFQRPEPGALVRWYRVVGVVGEVRQQSLEVAPAPMIYTTMAQSGMGHFRDWQMAMVVETAVAPGAAAAAVRRAAESVSGGFPIFGFRTMEEVVDANLAARRFTVSLLIAFGALALLLATVGVYGLLAALVSERTREIGMRLALGASPGRMLQEVLGEGLTRGLIGLVVGLGGAALGSRLLVSLLYGITPLDPGTYGAIAATLLLAALGAAALPAWRAARVDPIQALRYD